MIDSLLEKNILPDFILRAGIRRLLKQRLEEENRGGLEQDQAHFMQLIAELKNSPIAINTQEANEQHYEVPTQFYQYVLGKNLKYSSGYWKEGVTNFDQSETDMLELSCQHAELQDGQKILELGCGWGSLSLFMAAKYPNAQITAVSNSKTQKEFIDGQAKARGIQNLTIITCDMNEFVKGHLLPHKDFDRIVSVEMFEHMRNYQLLLEKISGFLNNEGKLFVHIFTHKKYAYYFDVKDESDWMSKYFFTGGIMPSDHLLFYFQDHFKSEQHWRVCGTHYAKTSEAWLQNMDYNASAIKKLFADTYGTNNVTKWWVYWRVFFMACAELWGYKNGEEWFVSHYLFKKR